VIVSKDSLIVDGLLGDRLREEQASETSLEVRLFTFSNSYHPIFLCEHLTPSFPSRSLFRCQLFLCLGRPHRSFHCHYIARSGFLDWIHCTNTPPPVFMLFVVCVRLTTISTVCREEQHSYCNVTFYSSPTSPPSPILALVIASLAAFSIPIVVRRILGKSKA